MALNFQRYEGRVSIISVRTSSARGAAEGLDLKGAVQMGVPYIHNKIDNKTPKPNRFLRNLE